MNERIDIYVKHDSAWRYMETTGQYSDLISAERSYCAAFTSQEFSARWTTWRAPALHLGEVLLYDEPGRVLVHVAGARKQPVCYSAFHFRLVRTDFGEHVLRVKHGGGEEEFRLGHESNTVEALRFLDPDERFHLMHTIMQVAHDVRRITAGKVEREYQEAFVEGRLKKRKIRGRDAVRVVIEDKK